MEAQAITEGKFMNKSNKTPLVIAFIVVVVLFLIFGGGTMMNGGMMGKSIRSGCALVE